jgi:hypothetical protein
MAMYDFMVKSVYCTNVQWGIESILGGDSLGRNNADMSALSLGRIDRSGDCRYVYPTKSTTVVAESRATSQSLGISTFGYFVIQIYRRKDVTE